MQYGDLNDVCTLLWRAAQRARASDEQRNQSQF